MFAIFSIFSCVINSIVCEVLPTICESKEVNCALKQYHKWLQKAIEFYTVYATQPAWKLDQKGAKGPPTPLMSPGIKSTTAKGHGFGLGELVRPWESLRRLLAMIATKCGWDSKFVPDEERFVDSNFFIEFPYSDFHMYTLKIKVADGFPCTHQASLLT